MNKTTVFRAIAGICIAVGALAMSACSKNEPDSAAKTGKPAAQKNADQQGIEKYNHYIKAANTDGKFAFVLEYNEKYVIPALKSGEQFDHLYVVDDYDIKGIKSDLEAGLAISVPMPELDQAAKNYAEALARLEPLNPELKSYAETKGFLSDGGAKAKEKGPAYFAALGDVIKAQEAFDEATDKQDMLNVKQEFDRKKPDTAAYFRAGILYHGKLSLAASDDFFSDTENAEARANFKASLDKVNDMLTGLEGKLKPGSSCFTVRSLLSSGRGALADAEKGNFRPRNSSRLTREDAERTLTWARNDFSQQFKNMITRFNQQRLCD